MHRRRESFGFGRGLRQLRTENEPFPTSRSLTRRRVVCDDDLEHRRGFEKESEGLMRSQVDEEEREPPFLEKQTCPRKSIGFGAGVKSLGGEYVRINSATGLLVPQLMMSPEEISYEKLCEREKQKRYASDLRQQMDEKRRHSVNTMRSFEEDKQLSASHSPKLGWLRDGFVMGQISITPLAGRSLPRDREDGKNNGIERKNNSLINKDYRELGSAPRISRTAQSNNDGLERNWRVSSQVGVQTVDLDTRSEKISQAQNVTQRDEVKSQENNGGLFLGRKEMYSPCEATPPRQNKFLKVGEASDKADYLSRRDKRSESYVLQEEQWLDPREESRLQLRKQQEEYAKALAEQVKEQTKRKESENKALHSKMATDGFFILTERSERSGNKLASHRSAGYPSEDVQQVEKFAQGFLKSPVSPHNREVGSARDAQEEYARCLQRQVEEKRLREEERKREEAEAERAIEMKLLNELKLTARVKPIESLLQEGTPNVQSFVNVEEGIEPLIEIERSAIGSLTSSSKGNGTVQMRSASSHLDDHHSSLDSYTLKPREKRSSERSGQALSNSSVSLISNGFSEKDIDLLCGQLRQSYRTSIVSKAGCSVGSAQTARLVYRGFIWPKDDGSDETSISPRDSGNPDIVGCVTRNDVYSEFSKDLPSIPPRRESLPAFKSSHVADTAFSKCGSDTAIADLTDQSSSNKSTEHRMEQRRRDINIAGEHGDTGNNVPFKKPTFKLSSLRDNISHAIQNRLPSKGLSKEWTDDTPSKGSHSYPRNSQKEVATIQLQTPDKELVVDRDNLLTRSVHL